MRLFLACCVALLSLINGMQSIAAQPLPLTPGTTVLSPLTSEAAKKQAIVLAKLREWPKQVPSDDLTFTNRTNPQLEPLRYRLYKPKNFDPSKVYPLVLWLHGGGQNKRFEDLLDPSAPGYGLGRFVSPDTQSMHPSFVLVPWRWYEKLDFLRVTALLEATMSKTNIDPKRIYVTGQSAGGTGAWRMLALRPHIFAAAVPICGLGNPATAFGIKDIPIWAIHGDKDTSIPVSSTRNIVKALLEAGGKPIYWEYTGATHAETAERGYCEPMLIDWLFEQARR